jgi:hypothetical protein
MKTIRYAIIFTVPLAFACGRPKPSEVPGTTTTTGVELDSEGRPCPTDKNDLRKPPPQAYGGPERGVSPSAPVSGAMGSGGGGTVGSGATTTPPELSEADEKATGCPKTPRR